MDDEDELNSIQLLIVAALRGSVEDVERYLSSGVDVNCHDKWNGCTPLYVASEYGRTEVVKLLLLKYNADPNISDKNGQTPLHVADNEVIAECLINSGADINRLDNALNTPLHTVAYNVGNFFCRNAMPIVQYLVENGASVTARNKLGQTPIDILKEPHNYDWITEEKKHILQWINEMGYLEDPSTVPIADLSTELSSSSPSIDKMDSYGLRVDVDPSSLSNGLPPVLVDIKVFTVDDDVLSTPSFTFPEDTKPVSAVYTISLSDTQVPLRNLRIRHHVDPNNHEELSQLTFVKSSDDSSSKLEVVPGGIFSPGEQYGEITPRSHRGSNWSIIGKIKNLFNKKTRYVGTILYHTVRQHPNQWLMELMVAKHNPTSTLALNEYINHSCGYDVMKELQFLFTFKDSERCILYLKLQGTDERILKCSNGWEVHLDMYEITQDTVNHFKRSTDVPGRCTVNIHTHMNVCHELAELPMVELNGITSDKKDIQINPPIPDGTECAAVNIESDYSNVRPHLKSRGVTPTLKTVFALMKCYSSKWDKFGRELEISINDRDNLRSSQLTAEARLERVINQWIESQCSPTTWEYLIRVLKGMGLQNAIDVIEGTPIVQPSDKTKLEIEAYPALHPFIKMAVEQLEEICASQSADFLKQRKGLKLTLI